MGDRQGAYRVLVGRPLGQSRNRWKDNIKMDLQLVGWGHVDWITLVEDTDKWQVLVNVVMNLRIP
jgi:hypothetical protein